MNFEQKLRSRITAAPLGSVERDILRVVLGEYQQKSSMTKNFTEEQAFSIVKKMVEANKENLKLLTPADVRLKRFEEENSILESLLPAYLSATEIRPHLVEVEIKAAKSDGQAVGLAMKTLKSKNLMVEGDTVKHVVTQIRAS